MINKALAPSSSPEMLTNASDASFAITAVSSCKSIINCLKISGIPKSNCRPSGVPVTPKNYIHKMLN